MPRLSDTMEEGELAKWLKQVGDPVAKGDVIAEIETDKATMDLESFEDGILEQHLVEEGALVPIGAPVAIIGDGSGTSAAPKADAPKKAAKTEEEPDAASTEEPAEAEGSAESDDSAVEEAPQEGSALPTPETGAGGEGEKSPSPDARGAPQETTAQDAKPSKLVSGGVARMSPLARKLARDNNLDPASIKGSGPDGRIIRADVEAAISAGGAVEASAAPSRAPKLPDGGTESRRVEVSRIRKVAAKRLSESQLVPHFFLTAEAEVDRLLELRRELNTALEAEGQKVSVNDLIVRAVAVTLVEHPEANAQWDGDAVIEHGRVNIGMAVATDDGLLVPVIKDANLKSVLEIGEESRELAGRARDGKLKLDEMTGGTFSVSNLGMFGIDEFTAMLNPPEAGILAVGAASPVPQLRDGALVNVNKLKVTLTCDHRVMDGAVGAAFLRDLVGVLESPIRILL